jgi:hypothetical protein
VQRGLAIASLDDLIGEARHFLYWHKERAGVVNFKELRIQDLDAYFEMRAPGLRRKSRKDVAQRRTAVDLAPQIIAPMLYAYETIPSALTSHVREGFSWIGHRLIYGASGRHLCDFDQDARIGKFGAKTVGGLEVAGGAGSFHRGNLVFDVCVRELSRLNGLSQLVADVLVRDGLQLAKVQLAKVQVGTARSGLHEAA